MIAPPAEVAVWLAAGATDMRKGFDGLAALIQTQLSEDPFSGQLYVFRGRAGDRVKILWWSGDGLCLFAKRLERGRFVWPQATQGTIAKDALHWQPSTIPRIGDSLSGMVSGESL